MRDVVRSCLVSLEGDAAAFHAAFRFPGDLDVFHGHFPGHPLVPGVFLIEAARVAAERVLGRPAPLVRVRDAKFMAPVLPDTEIVLAGSVDAARCRAACDGVCRIDIDLGGDLG